MTIKEYYETQSKFKGKNYKMKILRNIIGISCLCIILFSIYTIFKWCVDNYKIRQINQEILDEAIINKANDNKIELVNPPINKNDDYYYYSSFSFYQIDFPFLLSKNSDTVAFIHIKNTNINYPVVKTSDNNYYLNHSFDKKENKAGWIFMDYRNDINDLDDNTIIYGHARLDGTMFGSLKNVLTSSWQNDKDNYVIFFSNLKQDMIFQIFSIYTVKSEGYYITPNFYSILEKQKWIDTMKKRNIAKIDTIVDVKDKILTLSTCQNYQDRRIVVHAKLIKKQSRKN